MKIGILTFHWATNYGAVLQAFALQAYLESRGHKVEVINFKPRSYDLNILYLLRHPSQIMKLKAFVQRIRKEKLIDTFRQNYLHLTPRVSEGIQIDGLGHYDAVITGSDQVLNPSFALYGEGKPTGVYFLNTIRRNTKRIAYAVSFGCKEYPGEVSRFAERWIRDFAQIGVRENSGVQIVKQLGYTGKTIVVPDPVVLNGRNVIMPLIKTESKHQDYICIYTLRRKVELKNEHVIILDDVHAPITMEEWLTTIANAKVLVTNSYHGMIVAILCHVPFVVDIEKNRGSGMNDRFFTLLERIGLTNRIADEQKDIERLLDDNNIDWEAVEGNMNTFRNDGKSFLENLG